MLLIVIFTKVITMADNGNAPKTVPKNGFRSRPYDGPMMPKFPTTPALIEPLRVATEDRMKFALERI